MVPVGADTQAPSGDPQAILGPGSCGHTFGTALSPMTAMHPAVGPTPRPMLFPSSSKTGAPHPRVT